MTTRNGNPGPRPRLHLLRPEQAEECTPNSARFTPKSPWKSPYGAGGHPRQRVIGGAVTWEARYYTSDGKRRSVYGKTEADCRRRLKEAIAAAAGGAAIKDRRLTTGYQLRKWLAAAKDSAGTPAGIEWTTYRNYDHYTKDYLIPQLGKIRLGDLNGSDVEAMMAHLLKQGRSVYVANECRRTLRIMLNKARRAGLVVRNAAEDAAALKGSKTPDVKVLQPADGRRLPQLAAAYLERGNPGKGLCRAAPAVVLMVAMMGMRQEEALGLQLDNLDLQRGVVQVRTALVWDKVNRCWRLKGLKRPEHQRNLTMPATVAKAVAEWLDHRAERQALLGADWGPHAGWNLVFTNEGGAPLRGETLGRAFKRMLELGGLPPHSFYSLRHQAGTYLLLQGHDLRTVQGQLGHTNLQTTQRYTKLAAAFQQDAIAASQEAFYSPAK